jgi:hypothetical protein
MKDDNSLETSPEFVVNDLPRSRTEMMLDATSLAVVLACSGSNPCVDLSNEEIDQIDKNAHEKLCRVTTDETCETKTWNEYMPRPLLDEEETVLSWESIASGNLEELDEIDEAPSSQEAGDEQWKQTPLFVEMPPQKESETGGKVPNKMKRKDQVEVILYEVPKEDKVEKKRLLRNTKEIWIPIVKETIMKNKMVNIIQKCHLNEGQRFKSLTKAQTVAKSVAKAQLLAIAKKFKQKPTDEGEENVANDEILAAAKKLKPKQAGESEGSNGSSVAGREETKEESDASSVFAETLRSNRAIASLAGFEVNRISTNHVAIIDRSLLLREDKLSEGLPSEEKHIQAVEVTPLFSTAKIEDLSDVEDKLKPLALLTVRTFNPSLFANDLLMPLIKIEKDDNNENIDKDETVSLTPKPVSFFDVLNEGSTVATVSALDHKSDMISGISLKENDGQLHLPAEEESHDDRYPNIKIEETINNDGESSHFEVIPTVRPPYKMSRDVQDQEELSHELSC